MIFSLTSAAFRSRSVAQDLWLKIVAFLAQAPRGQNIMGMLIPGGIIYSSRLEKWCVKGSVHVTEYVFNANQPSNHSVCF